MGKHSTPDDPAETPDPLTALHPSAASDQPEPEPVPEPVPREYPEAAPGQAGDDTPDDTADSLDNADNLTLPDDDDDSELDTGD